jgi:hypothetical protein
MTRYSWAQLIVVCGSMCLLSPEPAGADEAAFNGEWRTSIGTGQLKQTGDAVTGTYGDAGQFTLSGTVAGRKLTFSYQEGQARGDASWNLDKAGNSFTGGFQIRGGQAGNWLGWRPDPAAPRGPSRTSPASGAPTSA